MAMQRAAMASQGGDVNDGSPVDLFGDTAAKGELDALTIRSNAQQDYNSKVAQAQAATTRANAAGLQAGMYDAKAAGTMSNLPLSLLAGR